MDLKYKNMPDFEQSFLGTDGDSLKYLKDPQGINHQQNLMKQLFC